MTNTEAIKNIKSMLAVITPEWARESLEVAVTSMERDEPMKPVKVGMSFYCQECEEFVGTGPENTVNEYGEPDSYHKNYCEECGREVKWEDEA